MTTTNDNPLALVLGVKTADGLHPRLAWLTWATEGLNDADALQVVVDDELHDVVDPHRPGIWIRLSRPHPRVELRLVDAANGWESTGSTHFTPHVTIHRDPALPLDTRLRINTDDGQTLLDHSLWDATIPRVGFGSLFGQGHFGFDDAPAPGLGEAALGFGPLGFDQPPLTFRPSVDALLAGTHRLSIETDHTQTAAMEVIVDQLADPPQGMSLADDVLTWS